MSHQNKIIVVSAALLIMITISLLYFNLKKMETNTVARNFLTDSLKDNYIPEKIEMEKGIYLRIKPNENVSGYCWNLSGKNFCIGVFFVNDRENMLLSIELGRLIKNKLEAKSLISDILLIKSEVIDEMNCVEENKTFGNYTYLLECKKEWEDKGLRLISGIEKNREVTFLTYGDVLR